MTMKVYALLWLPLVSVVVVAQPPGIVTPPPDDGTDYCCFIPGISERRLDFLADTRSLQSESGCDPCSDSADTCTNWRCYTMVELCAGGDNVPCTDEGNENGCCRMGDHIFSCGVPQDTASCPSCSYGTFCPADNGGGTNGGGGGDPHFKTWTGSWFDFHGVCDLILVQANKFAKGLGLDIHIRTKERFGYAFIESAVIRIGDSLLEVSGFGAYMLNGISQAELSNKMADLYAVTHEEISDKEHVFTIRRSISSKEKIVVSTFKDMVSVKIEHATKMNFGNSVGLMGSFGDGSLVGRDRTTIFQDHNAFGQEWQVLDSEDNLFQTIRTPQHPQTCIIPDPNTHISRRRLGEGIVREDAEEACAHYWEHDVVRNDMCIFDVLAMQDLDVAQAVGVF